DLSCVSGRDCILFPANDRDSQVRMQDLAAALYAAGHKIVRGVDPEELGESRFWPGDLEATAALAYAKAHVRAYAVPSSPERAVGLPDASASLGSDAPQVVAQPAPAPSSAAKGNGEAPQTPA